MYKTFALGALALLASPALANPSSDWTPAAAPPPPPPPPSPPAPPAEPWKVTPPPVEPWKTTPPPAASVVHVTFQGANPPVAQFERTVPANGQPFYPNDPLSISHLITDGGACTFFGIDGLVLKKEGGGLVDVGPPQTITKVVCEAPKYEAKRFAA